MPSATPILQKPGRLTPEEFAEMHRHVLVGGQTLEMARDQVGPGTFMDMAAEIARYHHEKFDGSGYCAGLRGEAIPLSARIVALADVYDALTSQRIYKAAYSPQSARGIVIGESGHHFDPVIVEAFVARFDDFQEPETSAAARRPSMPLVRLPRCHSCRRKAGLVRSPFRRGGARITAGWTRCGPFPIGPSRRRGPASRSRRSKVVGRSDWGRPRS